MAVVDTLVIRLIGESSSYNSMMMRANGQLRTFETTSRRVNLSLSQLTSAVSNLGYAMTTFLSAPLIGFGASSLKAFADFDSAMVKSTAIMGNLTDETKQRMAGLARAISRETTTTSVDLANAYYELASAGFTAKEAMSSLSVVEKFARAGQFDLAKATGLLAGSTAALGLKSKDPITQMKNMTRVADVLTKANQLAHATTEEYADALANKAAAALRFFNKSVEEGVAVLAVFAEQEKRGKLGGAALDRVIRLLTKSYLQAGEKQKELGFTVFDEATGKMAHFADIAKDLERITKGMSEELRTVTLDALGFDQRIQQVIFPLIGASNSIREFEARLGEAGGTVREVSEKQLDSFSAQMQILKNRITTVREEIGDLLVPRIMKLNAVIENVIDTFRSLSERQQIFVVDMASLIAITGPALILISVFTRVMMPFIAIMRAASMAVIGLASSLLGLAGTVLTLIGPWAALGLVILGGIAIARYFLGSWENVAIVFGNLINAMTYSFIAMLRILSRSSLAFAAWLPGALVRGLQKAFTIDFWMIIGKGLSGAVDLFNGFTNWARRAWLSVFTGGFIGPSFDPFNWIERNSVDMRSAEGATVENLFKEFGRITRDEFRALSGLGPIIPEHIMNEEVNPRIENIQNMFQQNVMNPINDRWLPLQHDMNLRLLDVKDIMSEVNENIKELVAVSKAEKALPDIQLAGLSGFGQ